MKIKKICFFPIHLLRLQFCINYKIMVFYLVEFFKPIFFIFTIDLNIIRGKNVFSHNWFTEKLTI